MANLMIQSGDFLQGPGQYHNGVFTLKTSEQPVHGETIALHRIKQLSIANQEATKDLGSALRWGAAGALLLGPIGLIIGLWLGGRSEEITFIATLKDGRKLMASTHAKTFSAISEALDARGSPRIRDERISAAPEPAVPQATKNPRPPRRGSGLSV